MVIAGNNLAEKLFGHAISREHLQRSTAFCALLEDPDLALDIDLAVDFHAALNGNSGAATRLVNALVLNSNTCLDQSTINFYVDKMISHPDFKPQIDRINTIFNDANFPNISLGENLNGNNGNGEPDRDSADAGFFEDLKRASQDCVSEPCNIFTATSDSVGRAAQSAATKTSENVFDLGGLKDSATNIINGLDETIFNSIPAAFQKGIAEVTTIAKEAQTQLQAVAAGKANLNELIDKAIGEGSCRASTDNMLPFTPDIKSFLDFTQAAPELMAEAAKNLGGCYNKYQHAFRYNPYTDNDSLPELLSDSQVNGATYTTDPGGSFDNAGHTPESIGDCSSVGSGIPDVAWGGGAPGSPSVNSGNIPDRSSSISFAEGEPFETETAWISRPMIIGPKTKTEGYSVFGGFIDYESKEILVDNYTSTSPGGNSNDDLTMNGVVFVPSMLICPSFWIDPGDKGGGTAKALGGTPLADKRYLINKLSNGYTHNVTEEGMAVQQNSKSSKVFDDGVAISKKMIKALGGYDRLSTITSTWNGKSNKNQAFAILRRAGECPKIFKIVDYNSQNMYNVDMTPAAYKVMFGKNPPNKPIKTQNSVLQEFGWNAGIAYHGNEGQIEASIAIGEYEEIKAIVEKEFECGAIELATGNWRDHIVLQSQLSHPLIVGSQGSKTEKEDRAVELLNPALIEALINISKSLGRKITLNSGKRSKAYMSATGQGGSYKPGSQHNLGNAADVTMSGINRAEFVEAAGKAGINGIGFYNTFIHVDVRNYKAKWGPYSPYASILRKHGWSV